MINYNGNLQTTTEQNIENNRGFLFGDAIFETIKVNGTKILFLEEHYLRLMASMRICRMEIPMSFTMEFMESEILKLIAIQKNTISNRVRFTVFRNSEGLYFPIQTSVGFVITCSALENDAYLINNQTFEVELYKDFYVSKHLLATIKTNNRMINITASIFAKENEFDTCLLINDDKNISEAINGNIFMKMGNEIITPPITDGCVNGIMRKQIIKIVNAMEDYTLIEKSISPFDLQKADELFVTNVIAGVQSITKYRKKEYISIVANEIVKKLNVEIN